jgi:hypothetical protein
VISVWPVGFGNEQAVEQRGFDPAAESHLSVDADDGDAFAEACAERGVRIDIHLVNPEAPTPSPVA